MKKLYFFVLLMLFTTTPQAQVGTCIQGLYNVYDRECDRAELDSGMCTTRISDTPEARWCCCDEEYPLSQCAALFDAILGKSSANEARSSLMDDAREFRDRVMANDERAKRYIDDYYANTGDLIVLLLSNPGLAKETARVLKDNRKTMVEMTTGNSAKVSSQQMLTLLRLVANYGIEAGSKSDIARVAHRLARDLTDRKWLEKIGVIVADK